MGALYGIPAELGGEGLDVLDLLEGELLDLPDALLAVGDDGEVDALGECFGLI